MSEENKALARKLFDSINAGNMSEIDTIVADNFVEHEEMPPGFPTGKEGVKALFNAMRAAFPDLQVVVERALAEGDMVAVLAVFKGTQVAEFMGLPSAGKSMAINVSDWLRIQDGKVVEHWGVMDMAAMMQQLGAEPH